MPIPFNKPYATGKEITYIEEAINNAHLSGDGPFTKKCHAWLESTIQTKKALLTNSCTAALEMAAILADLKEGDEVIMPSFTFVSTANAFVLRGAVPVFVDIRPDTVNIDEKLIRKAITKKTKAIVPVHYAGVSCEMDVILALAEEYNLLVIEDAAQGILSTYKGRQLGSVSHMAALSFHETKNIISGEGGALLVNDPKLIERAEIIREKGTNRSLFFRGQVDKYRWMDIGSSFLPSELQAAYLWAQLEAAQEITSRRLEIWNNYYRMLAPLEASGLIRRPIVPEHCGQNGHLFYILLAHGEWRDPLLTFMREKGVGTMFHYVPLHSAPAGQKFCRVEGSLTNTESVGECLIRLPFWNRISLEEQEQVVSLLGQFLTEQAKSGARPKEFSTKP